MAQFIGLQKLVVMGQTELTVDRPVDRSPNGQKSDRWRSTGRSTDSSDWPITASFWSPKLGHLGAILDKIF